MPFDTLRVVASIYSATDKTFANKCLHLEQKIMTAISNPSYRKSSLDSTGIATMIVLCAIWGFQQVAIKAAINDIPPIWQSGMRSIVAAILVGVGLWLVKSRWHRGLLLPGILAGVLFSLEFGLLYVALRYTDAARASLLLYTSPFVVAIGAHFFISGERLSLLGWLGVGLAFIGTATMMKSGFTTSPSSDNQQWLGDILALGGGIAWGMTTLLVRLSKLTTAPPSQTLFYQLWVSGVLLCFTAWCLEGNFSMPLTTLAWVSMGFQILVIASLSYLAWFVLITRYAVTKLSVFGFLTPLFGSIYGVIFLDEVIGLNHFIALLLIILGIIIVNRYGHQQKT